MKFTVEQIRERFDREVERFSNLETGQSATIDAALVLDLIIRAAAATNPNATHVLDIGCGAGNYTLKLLQALPNLHVTLVDLSQPMLDRAVQRISHITSGQITTYQADIRALDLDDSQFDIILAAAVFHHLREEPEWRSVFAKMYSVLKPGGSFWISDLIEHSTPHIQAMMWERYGDYLTQLKDERYRDHVFDYIEKEDTPRPLLFQIDLLREVGFSDVEILHKHSCFAAFGALKGLAQLYK
jgi:tRNA (cmo5U34)-methyltransferase